MENYAYNLSYGLIYLAGFFWLLTLIGLYKPWLALWWSDYCPRKKVLKIYGTIALSLSILFIAIRLVLSTHG
jgi:hypothetical protein